MVSTSDVRRVSGLTTSHPLLPKAMNCGKCHLPQGQVPEFERPETGTTSVEKQTLTMLQPHNTARPEKKESDGGGGGNIADTSQDSKLTRRFRNAQCTRSGVRGVESRG